MKKKLCAGLLVTSMILSSSVMAFAAAGDSTSHGLLTSDGTIATVTGGQITTDQQISGNGSVDIGLINVDMPTSAQIILNPNRVEGKDQVLSTIIPFKNYSNVGIDVKLVQATTEVPSGSNMIFVPKTNYDATVPLVSQALAGTPNEFGDAFKDKKFGAIYLERYVVSEQILSGGKLSLSDSVLRSVGIATGSDLVATDPGHPEWAPYVGIDASGNSLSASDSPISLGKVSNSPRTVSETAVGGIVTSDDSLLESGSMMFLKFNGDLSPFVMWEPGDRLDTTLTFRLQPASVTTADSLYGN